MYSTLFRRNSLSLLNTLELQARLANFQGSQALYPFILGPFTLGLCTEGVQWLKENTDCSWLVNAILRQQHDPHSVITRESFQVWTLKVNAEKAAMLIAEDGSGQVLMREEIHSTDFPLSEIVLWVEHSEKGPILRLPNEH